jgi:uncharacterized protein YjiS (DUF1127 family)
MKTLVKSIATKIAKYNRYRRTVIELSNLTNRDLADIGISRCDIPRVAQMQVIR